MIGYSFSLCIKDCVEGKVDPDDIKLIIAGTKCESESDWRKAIGTYSVTYWKENPHLGIGIAWNLVFSGRVIQPRVFGLETPDLSNYGRWVKDAFSMDLFNDWIHDAMVGILLVNDDAWQWEVC